MAFNTLKKVCCLIHDGFFSGSAQKKYEARHTLLTHLAIRWGMRLYNKNLIWHKDKGVLDILWSYPESKKSKVIHERRYHLYYLANAVKNLQGDTAECGVFRGEGSFVIMKILANTERTHHIFDSFEGLSEPDSRDTVEAQHTFKWKKNDLSTPEDIVIQNLKNIGQFKLHKGWIPDRFNDVKDSKFCFVHIDVDLYQPTFDSLAFFYERTVPGGMILCDDYGFESCPGAYQAFHDFMRDKPEEIISLVTGQGLIIKK